MLPILPPKVVLLTSILSLNCVVNGKPFGTINGLGQHNEHEMITRLAFQCSSGQPSDGICFEPISLDNLAGTHVGSIPGLGDNGMVGSPDDLPPEPPSAHCDDADYLDIPAYPKTRAQATAQLQACVDHLRMRFSQAVRGTARMLNTTTNQILRPMTDLKSNECDHDHRETTENTGDKAKCVALEGFGRALHGIQDFYSHSNWADLPNSNLPISVTNPPGLNRTDPAPFLNLRLTGSIASQVPVQLSTGCYVLLDSVVGRSDCKNRITHAGINKDTGIITLGGSITPDEDPLRNEVPGNFVKAVNAAVKDSQRQWALLRQAIVEEYGSARGLRMICGLVRDRPHVDCVCMGGLFC